MGLMTSSIAALARRRWPLLLIPLVLGLTGCSPDDPANTFGYNGTIAKTVGDLFWVTFWWATAVFILVHVALLYVMWRYRRRPGHTIPTQVHGNTRLEVMWTVLPTIVLVAVGIPTIRTLFELDEAP